MCGSPIFLTPSSSRCFVANSLLSQFTHFFKTNYFGSNLFFVKPKYVFFNFWSYMPLPLQEFPWASPSGTPFAKGVYLTVYPSSCPKTETIDIFPKPLFIQIKIPSHLDRFQCYGSFFPCYNLVKPTSLSPHLCTIKSVQGPINCVASEISALENTALL